MLSLSERLQIHLGNLGRLSLSILENYVAKVTGSEALKIVKEPYERDKRIVVLVEALNATEDELRENNQIGLLNLDLGEKADIVQAAEEFENNIDFGVLEDVLADTLQATMSTTDAKKLAHYYVDVFSRKLIACSSDEYREKLQTVSLLEIQGLFERVVKQSQTRDQKIVDLLEQILDALRNPMNLLVTSSTPLTTVISVEQLQDASWKCSSMRDSEKRGKLFEKVGLYGERIQGMAARLEADFLIEKAEQFDGLSAVILALGARGFEQNDGEKYTVAYQGLLKKYTLYLKQKGNVDNVAKFIEQFRSSPEIYSSLNAVR